MIPSEILDLIKRVLDDPYASTALKDAKEIEKWVTEPMRGAPEMPSTPPSEASPELIAWYKDSRKFIALMNQRDTDIISIIGREKRKFIGSIAAQDIPLPEGAWHDSGPEFEPITGDDGHVRMLLKSRA